MAFANSLKRVPVRIPTNQGITKIIHQGMESSFQNYQETTVTKGQLYTGIIFNGVYTEIAGSVVK